MEAAGFFFSHGSCVTDAHCCLLTLLCAPVVCRRSGVRSRQNQNHDKTTAARRHASASMAANKWQRCRASSHSQGLKPGPSEDDDQDNEPERRGIGLCARPCHQRCCNLPTQDLPRHQRQRPDLQGGPSPPPPGLSCRVAWNMLPCRLGAASCQGTTWPACRGGT